MNKIIKHNELKEVIGGVDPKTLGPKFKSCAGLLSKSLRKSCIERLVATIKEQGVSH